MATVGKVWEPLNATHLQEVMTEFHTTYEVPSIYFEQVVAISEVLFRFIAVYDDGKPAEYDVENEAVKEVEDNDYKGNTRKARASKSKKSSNSQ